MEIKFRGQRSETKEWVIGDLIRHGGTFIMHPINEYSSILITSKVIPETVGQFTGFTDKAGREIFGGQHIGDFVEVDGETIQTKHEVYFDQTEGQWKIDESFYRNKAVGHPLFQALKDFDYYIINEK